MINFLINFINNLYFKMKSLKKFFIIIYIFFSHKFSRLHDFQKIKDVKIIFFYFPFGLKNKKAVSLIKSRLIEGSHNYILVSFTGDSREYLRNFEIESFVFKEAWTNIDVDINNHSNVQTKIKEYPTVIHLIKVQLYEYLLTIERFLSFINKGSMTDGTVIFLLEYKDMLAVDCDSLIRYFAKKDQKCIKLFFVFGKAYMTNWFSLKMNLSYIFKAYKRIFYYFKKKIILILRYLGKDNSCIYNSQLKKCDLKQRFFSKFKNIKSPILIFYSGEVGSNYWKALLVITKEFKRVGVNYLCIVEDFLIYQFLILKQIKCFYLIKKNIVREEYKICSFNDEINLLFTDCLTESKKKFEELKNLCEELDVKKIILLPHWSSLGSLAARLKDTEAYQNIKLISMPLVTVNGNCASIVGWEILDEIYCYGAQCISAFKKMNFLEKNLKLCGNILLDPYINNTKIISEKKILIATSRLDINENLWIEKVIEYAILHGYQCIIKVHPSFSKNDYVSLKKYGSNYIKIVEKTNDLYKLILNSAICITDCSTVGAEAILLNKMLLVVNLLGKDFNANQYGNLGVALEAKTLDEVVSFLNRLLYDSKTREKLQLNYDSFYKLYNYNNDGKSIERFVKNILES